MSRRLVSYLILLILLFSVVPGTVIADSPPVQSCGGIDSRLSVNTQARWLLAESGNLRASPGRDGSGIAIVPSGSMVTVLEGPQCVDDFMWWSVNYNGNQGWLPEGGNGQYWLAPANNPGLNASSVPNVLSRIALPVQLDSQLWQGFPTVISRQACAGRTGTAAYVEDRQVVRAENGSTIALNPSNIAGSLPVICTNQAVERATAIGPIGVTVDAAIARGDGVTAVTLPLEALNHEGTWRLNANNFEIIVNVPAFNGPQVITQPDFASFNRQQDLLIGGFAPFQRVALITMQSTESLPVAYEVQTDNTGKWYGSLNEQCLECIQAAVGENGESVVRHGVTMSGAVLTREQTEDLLHAVLWNRGQLSSPQCEAGLQSDLRIAGRAETTGNSENVIKSDTGIFGTTIGYIRPNTPIKLLYGPACEDGSVWWLVDYNGTVGWTTELQNNTDLLTTFVETETCANNWFFNLAIEESNCPRPVQNSRAAGHDFQGGRAYWYQDAPIPDTGQGVIFIIYNDGTWEAYSDTFNPDIHPMQDPNIQPPQDLFQPERGIGLIWRSNPAIREKLGWAYEPEYLFDGRFQFPDTGNPSYVYIDHGVREVVLKLNLENFTWIVAGNYQE